MNSIWDISLLLWLGFSVSGIFFSFIMNLLINNKPAYNYPLVFLFQSGLTILIIGPIISIAPILAGQGFSGFGVASIIIGFALIKLTQKLNEPHENAAFKLFSDNNKTIFEKLVESLENIKSNYNFDIEKAIEIDGKFYWKDSNYLLSIPIFFVSEETDKLKLITSYIYDNLNLESIMSNNKKPLAQHKITNREIDQYSGSVIHTDNIHYYSKEGNVSYVSNIKGNDFSLKGAIIGGLVAGGIGAVIGSRKELRSETETRDDRKVVFVYEQAGKVIKKQLPFEFIEFFDSSIPEKDLNFILSKKQIIVKPKN
jgi:hypothetical protein